MTGRTSRQRGKSFELQVAKELGGKRAYFESCDVIAPGLTAECKLRSKIPVSISKFYAQAEAAAMPDTIPVVVMKELGAKVLDSLVILKMKDFKTMLPRVPVPKPTRTHSGRKKPTITDFDFYCSICKESIAKGEPFLYDGSGFCHSDCFQRIP